MVFAAEGCAFWFASGLICWFEFLACLGFEFAVCFVGLLEGRMPQGFVVGFDVCFLCV